ncbi:hypothetical protein AND_000993 [Anopheles darlingi]|uniref:Oxidative stress-responsive serine-rich protein 1 n=1 Tax=Anopheles darlingi TaxID=43151 RepID=W5JW69_ANODA|nr:hypothetical protein AND_000993 [Anopheles darlingi]
MNLFLSAPSATNISSAGVENLIAKANMASPLNIQLELENTRKTFEQLQAASVRPACQTMVGRADEKNPFHTELDYRSAKRQQDHQLVKRIFGNRCECGAERTSTVATTSSGTAGASSMNKVTPHSKHSAVHLEHTIRNQPTFKHKHRAERKGIVRDAVLRNIGRCVHQCLRRQSEGKSSMGGGQHSEEGATAAVPPLKASRSETNLTACFASDASDDMLDFRLLIAQCNDLSLTSSSPGTAQKQIDVPNYTHTSFRVLRPTDFTWQQLSRTSVNARRYRKRQLKRCNSTSSLDSDGSAEIAFKSHTDAATAALGGSLGSNVADGEGLAGSSILAGSSAAGLNTANNSASLNASSASSAASASCSQQARLNIMPCDVTIDEMASYFETLVYIPKKMSSMAEMMYI